jgi:hypothetical protein
MFERKSEGARKLVVWFTAVAYAALVMALPFLGDFGVGSNMMRSRR